MRNRRILLALAIVGWIGAGLAQLLARRASDDQSRSRWRLTRNRFLLGSSIAMNTVVATTIYRAMRRREEPAQATSQPEAST